MPASITESQSWIDVAMMVRFVMAFLGWLRFAGKPALSPVFARLDRAIQYSLRGIETGHAPLVLQELYQPSKTLTLVDALLLAA
jgi:hypothetical protein